MNGNVLRCGALTPHIIGTCNCSVADSARERGAGAADTNGLAPPGPGRLDGFFDGGGGGSRDCVGCVSELKLLFKKHTTLES